MGDEITVEERLQRLEDIKGEGSRKLTGEASAGWLQGAGMNYGTPELRKMLKAHSKAHRQAGEQWQAVGYARGYMVSAPPFPEECREMRCGAKTRAGTPCKNLSIYDNGRCMFHGGHQPAPGQQKAKGKRRSAHNGNRPKRVFRHGRKAKPMEGSEKLRLRA
ncbi:MAG: hypothetical protein ACI8QT_000011 [Halioglobus sp.]|jgi:hypothetical protein